MIETSDGLELGGWYLAATTGCRVTLTDVPLPGLRVAAARAEVDGLTERVSIVSAAGGALPFKPDSFDGVISSDAFC